MIQEHVDKKIKKKKKNPTQPDLNYRVREQCRQIINTTIYNISNVK